MFAMILAAGRGERMRPLTDAIPKPLLEAGGKPLIVWQIEALARAGWRELVINIAHHADQFVARLGNGAALGVDIHWSREPQPLEAAGGIVTALPLLPDGPVLVVSGDHDLRCPDWHSRRFVAAMRDATGTPDHPVLLRIVPHTGHMTASSLSAPEWLTFAISELGMTAHDPASR